MTDTPPRFEDEYPSAGLFMMRIFAAGGAFRRIKRLHVDISGRVKPFYSNKMCVQFPSRLPRNEPCPCGSGIKAKKCHEQWT